MPVFFYWFRCTKRFWNNLLASNNPLLEKVVRADLLLANRSDTWTYQVLDALRDVPDPQRLLDAVRSRQPINVNLPSMDITFSFVICRVTDILFQLSCPRRQVQLCNLNLNLNLHKNAGLR